MKITKRDILVILYLVSVLALFLVYKFSVSPSMDKIDEVNNVNAGLQSQVTTLEAKLEHKAELEKEIEEMDAQIKGYASIYPTKITEEDIVLYVNEVNENIGMNVTSVSFSTPTTVYTVVGKGGAAKYSMALNQISVNVDYTTDYDGFKKIVDYINEDKEHRTISSVGVTVSTLLDEEESDAATEDSAEIKDPLNGNKAENEQILTGSFALSLFYLDGKVSDTEEIPRYDREEIPHGNENIFK